MKCLLFLIATLFAINATAQNEQYPVQIDNGPTILFPTKPVITGMRGYRESFVAETPHGTFTMIIQNHGNDSLPPSLSVDTLMNPYANDLMNNSMLGDISDTTKVTVGELRGMYYKMQWNESGDEPPMVVMMMTLMSRHPWKTYTIGYQYFDTGEKAIYNKESFIATLRE